MKYVAEPLADASGFRIHVLDGARAATYRDWLACMRDDPSGTSAFSACLAQLPSAAFAWECRPAVIADLDAAIQMVAIESPALASVQADPAPFAKQLNEAKGKHVTVFDNLGRDARLVVPTALVAPASYAHIASFVRGAPQAQLHAFWCEVARAVEARMQQRRTPLWVSTAGLGVSWLHVRLDDRPKYYRYAPFKRLS